MIVNQLHIDTKWANVLDNARDVTSDAELSQIITFHQTSLMIVRSDVGLIGRKTLHASQASTTLLKS